MKRTPEQIAAIETVGVNLCVDAGAGSGKTSVLVERIVSLIERGLADLEQVVAITFTENAAAEMKERLRRECRKRAPVENPAEFSRWRDIERRVQGARISTIHGFCSRLLRENALHLGLDPDFVVLAEAESQLMRAQAVSTTLHALLNDEDEAALHVASEFGLQGFERALEEFLNRPALIEHIGSTHPMDDPQSLLAGWERIVEECRRREMLEVARDPYLRETRERLATFEGLCGKGEKDGREALRRFQLLHLDLILANADTEAIAKCLANIAAEGPGRSGRATNWQPPEAFAELSGVEDDLREFAKKRLPKEVDPEREARAAQIACDFFRTFSRVASEHTRIKGDGYALDFEDLIHRALNMLRDNAAIRARTAKGIRYLLIDEFQDTDAVQFEIASLLTREANGPEIFIVGDAKQSIYYFRGAEVEVFRQAREESQRTIPLARNFRTVPEVLHFVNDVFAVSGLLRAVETEYRGMEPHRDPCGECRVEFILPEMQEEELNRSDYRAHEADLIAARLAQLCGDSPAIICDKDTGQPRPATFGDVAIIFRALSDVYFYEHSLKQLGIPYTLVSGSGFYQRQEIVDLRNLLTLVMDPWDEMALLGFLRSPMVGLSDEAILRLCGWGSEARGLAQAFNTGASSDDTEDALCLREARWLLTDLRAHRDLPLPELLRRALDLTGYEAVLLHQFLGTQKASNVRKLLDLAYDFSRTRQPRLGAFLRYLDEVVTEEVREGEAALTAEGAGAVRIMTVHKAKGLEFPIVVIPDLTRTPNTGRNGPIVADRELGLAASVLDDTGTLKPTAMREAIANRHAQREKAEEARVLYVAMTRARDWLLLGAAPTDKNVGRSWFQTFLTQYNLLSRKDGDQFGGTSWKAAVRRKLNGRRRGGSSGLELDTPPREAIEARIERLASNSVGRRLFSVSEILNQFPSPEPAQPTNGSAARDRIIDAATRGSLLHLIFQRWDYRTPVRPLVETLCGKGCPSIAKRTEVVDDLVAVAERFCQTEMGLVLAAQKNMHREEPFVLRVGENLVAGNIDAVLDDGTVIDYKTGEHTAAAHARYEWQVLLYALARKELCGTTPPAGYLVYVDSGDVVPVSITPGRIEAARAQAAQAIAALRT